MTTKTKEVNKTTLEADLERFTGTSTYYRYSPLFPQIYLTDGTKYLADRGYYWLIDIIGSCQPIAQIRDDSMLQEIQFWKLIKNKYDSAKVICERDSNDTAYTQYIPYTDSILETIKLYVQPLHLSPHDYNPEGKKVILLPSEY